MSDVARIDKRSLRKVPDDVEREIIRLYVDMGLTCVQIEKRVFYDASTVLAVLTRNGVPRRRFSDYDHQRLTEEDLAPVVDLYRSGLSARAGAERLGLSETAFLRRLMTAGEARRTASEAQRWHSVDKVPAEADRLQRQTAALLASVPEGLARREIQERLGCPSASRLGDALRRLRALGVAVYGHKRWTWTGVELADARARFMTERDARGPVPGGKGIERVSILPFRAYLERYLRVNAMSITELAGVIGVDDARMRVWLGSKEEAPGAGPTMSVGFDTVDRVMCQVGDVGALRELYPEKFDDVGYLEAA